MKLLFVYESLRIFEDNKGDYYSGWNQEIWNRYQSIFEDITIICRKDDKIYDSKFAKNHFELFDRSKINFIEIPNMYSSIKTYISIKKRLKLFNIIEQEVKKSDCIIVRLPNETSVLAVKLAKKYKKPFLVEVVGCAWDSLWNHSYRGKITALHNFLSMKNAVKCAPYALYVTNRFLQQRYFCNGNTIGISDVTLPTLDEEIIQRRIFKVKNKKNYQPIILGTLAAINVKYKGQEYVIKAISKLQKEGYNFEYHLAGGGDNSYLKSVAKKYGVSDKVKFLGSLPHKKVYEYLDEVDIYVQPSKLEGLPRALIEAMSRGCPSIGSYAGGIPELLNDEFLFHYGAVDELCYLLKRLDRKTMEMEAKRSFNKAKEFDNKILNNKRKSFYNMFVEGAKESND